MSESNLLKLPYMAAAQAQKHITHNEALRWLDGIVHLAVLNSTTSAPPGAPSEGDRYIVATGATGAWSGWDGDVAHYADGAWFRLLPQPGWRCWDIGAQALLVRISGAWVPIDEAIGLLKQATSVEVAKSANAATGLAVIEEDLTGLAGAYVESSILIPSRCVCLGVSTRTIQSITGASSYDCGIAGEASKFGGLLGVALGSTNIGVIGPTAFYSDTPVRLTANGADFTNGAVRIAIHYLTLGGA